MQQVDQEWMVDGYRNFFGIAEWWTYKTKFFAWYSKSFESVYLKLAAELELSPGHVPHQQYSHCFGLFLVDLVSQVI